MLDYTRLLALAFRAMNTEEKNQNAVALAKKRADKLSEERRTEIARNAAKTRWRKHKKKKK
jgi:hypothetical protein